MKTTARVSMFLLALVAIAIVVAPALADPWPGEWPKFVQRPMIRTTINDVTYFGHDEYSTAKATPGTEPGYYRGEFMADDFADVFKNDVVHVTWWGSYMDPAGVQAGVRKFLISFEEDVPAVVDASGNILEPSRPGKPLLSQVVTLNTMPPSAPGTFTEKWMDGGGAPAKEALFMYNAELARPFAQEANKVYWLKIVALLDEDQNFAWGWHNRDYTKEDIYASKPPAVFPGEQLVGQIPNPTAPRPTPIYHFQDDAVSGLATVIWPGVEPMNVEVYQDPLSMIPTHYLNGIDGPGPMPDFNFPGIGRYSKDLAFVLHAVPEPSTFVLLAVGLACLAGRRWRKQ